MPKNSENTALTLANLESGELLQRARDGDRSALDSLIARYLPQLQRLAHRRVPNWARNAVDTDDIVQETVLQTLGRLEFFEPRRQGALLGYLRRSLMNRVRDQFRRAAGHPVAELYDIHPYPGASPLECAIDEERSHAYRAGLQRLRPSDQTVIRARLELGYSYERLAIVTGRPSAEAARLAVRRALLRLAEEMRRV